MAAPFFYRLPPSNPRSVSGILRVRFDPIFIEFCDAGLVVSKQSAQRNAIAAAAIGLADANTTEKAQHHTFHNRSFRESHL